MVLLTTVLLFLTPAHAEEAHFPACRHIPVKLDLSTPVDPSKACNLQRAQPSLTPVMDRLFQSVDLHKAVGFMRPDIGGQLQKSIDARDVLIKCLNSPTPDCQKRTTAMKRTLEQHLTLLRTALALSPVPQTLDDHSVNRLLRLPGYIGGRRLPPLSNDEMQSAVKIQKLVMDRSETIREYDNKGRPIPPDPQRQECISQGQSCSMYRAYKNATFVHFREQMSKVAARVISDMPLVTQFDTVPISDEELKKVLEKTKDSLTEWKKEVEDPQPEGFASAALQKALSYTGKEIENEDDEFMLAYPDMMNKVLAQHTDLCDSVEKRYAQIEKGEKIYETVRFLGTVTAATGVCLGTEGLGCAALGVGLTGVSAAEVVNARSKTQVLTGRFTSLDTPGDLTNLADVKNTHTDLCIKAAFMVATAIPTAKLLTEATPLKAIFESSSAESAAVEHAAAARATVATEVAGNATEMAEGAGGVVGEVMQTGAHKAAEEGVSHFGQQGAKVALQPEDGGLAVDSLGNYIYQALKEALFGSAKATAE